MGKKYCVTCNKKCKSYAVRIADSVYVHSECFRCCECKGVLELSKFYFKNKSLYCIKDFKKLFYPKCLKCEQVIEDEMVKVMGQQYHLNCLCCSFCKATLNHGDKLNFDGKNLICRQCTLISLRVQSISKISFSDTPSKTLTDGNTTLMDIPNGQPFNNHKDSDSTLPKKQDSSLVTNSSPVSFFPTGKPPLFPGSKLPFRGNAERIVCDQKQVIPSSKNLPTGRFPKSTTSPCSEDRGYFRSSYLDRPSNFRRGPSFNVSHTSNTIHHFHVPIHMDGLQKFSRFRSRTLPKTAVFGPQSKQEGAGNSPNGAKSPDVSKCQVLTKETKTVSSPEPRSPQGRTLKSEERAISKDTLSKTPLPCISEDGMSVASHTSLHLPPKGFALKPGYGLKPIMYAFYGTSPDSKQHLHSGAVSVDDAKDTQSVSFGSDCYSSFYSAEDEEKLDPYTGLKRNRSIRSTVSYDSRMNRSKTLMEIVNSKRPITINHFLKKVEHSNLDRGSTKKYSYDNLMATLLSPHGRLVNRDHLEDYLADEEFQKLFSMTRVQFQQLPEWKRADLKRIHYLL